MQRNKSDMFGNAHSAALVGMNGSIDWFCFPHLDSPTVFAALLDDKKGGRFQITPTSVGSNYKQHYWPDTNVLVTRFLSPDGVGEISEAEELFRQSVAYWQRWLAKCTYRGRWRESVHRSALVLKLLTFPPSISTRRSAPRSCTSR